MVYAYITGGGTGWIYDSLKKGGASKWFLGARIPYNQKDFDDILGEKPFDGKYVSHRTAAQLSVKAYEHACKISDNNPSCIGLGVTAKLKTEIQREDRVNSVVVSKTFKVDDILKTSNCEMILDNSVSRIQQEIYVGRFIDNVLNDKNLASFDVSMFDTYDRVDMKDKHITLYSGSFNPIHKSHIEIVQYCKEIFPDNKIYLEIPSRNFSKGVVGPMEFNCRGSKIMEDCPDIEGIIYGDATTFVDKMKRIMLRGGISIVFPMGDDTFERLTTEEMDKLFANGVRILLFRRKYSDFMYRHPVIHQKSYNIPRMEQISSSEIRKNEI